ncbi:MAG TPA: aquaporin [Thermomicrobiales bacterium]|nr:aquaporin [Thermomicrobiales bacterium]
MVLPQDLLRKMVAEAIGTFILVLAGTGAAIVGGSYAFGFGFGLIGIVYAIGHISGAHVNPAISLGLAVTGRFPMAQVPYYVGSQIVGAIVASLFLRLVHGDLNGLGATSVVEGYSLLDGFLLEMVCAAILVFVVCAVATDQRVQPAAVGLAIGATLLFIELVAGPITGGSVNPARSIGPAIASWSFSDIWIYLTAPFIGGAIGAVGYEFIRGHEGWAEDRPGPEGPPPSDDRPRRQQAASQGTRRPAQAPVTEADPNAGRSRRQSQRPPAYEFVEEEFLETPIIDEDPLPPPVRRPTRQAPRDYEDDYPPQRSQRRRPPPQ